MPARPINYYLKNRYTEDIVYPYSNGEVDRYRKTENGILLIHKDKKGRIKERLLEDYEFSLSEFEQMKSISDEDYRKRNKGDVLEKRHTVPLFELEKTLVIPQEISAEEEFFSLIEGQEEEEDYRTIENAINIMIACLTDKQIKRFFDYYFLGRTQEQIAENEGISQRSVSDSIELAKKNIKKFFEKQVKNTSKIASKLYIDEGQEKRKNKLLEIINN